MLLLTHLLYTLKLNTVFLYLQNLILCLTPNPETRETRKHYGKPPHCLQIFCLMLFGIFVLISYISIERSINCYYYYFFNFAVLLTGISFQFLKCWWCLHRKSLLFQEVVSKKKLLSGILKLYHTENHLVFFREFSSSYSSWPEATSYCDCTVPAAGPQWQEPRSSSSRASCTSEENVWHQRRFQRWKLRPSG